MIPELGHYALALALFMALVQASVPLVGAARNDTALMEIGRNSALAQAVIEDPGCCAAVQEPGALAFYYSNNDVPNGSPSASVATRLREHFLDGRRHACK